REVALAGADEVGRHLADVGQERRLLPLPVGGLTGDQGEAGEDEEHRGTSGAGLAVGSGGEETLYGGGRDGRRGIDRVPLMQPGVPGAAVDRTPLPAAAE